MKTAHCQVMGGGLEFYAQMMRSEGKQLDSNRKTLSTYVYPTKEDRVAEQSSQSITPLVTCTRIIFLAS